MLQHTARLALTYPVILENIKYGRLTLSHIVEVSKTLTQENHLKVLNDIEALTQRGVEKYVAVLTNAPIKEHKDQIKFLGSKGTAGAGCITQERNSAIIAASAATSNAVADGTFEAKLHIINMRKCQEKH